MKKRVLSLFLAVVMIVLAIPAVILPTFGATFGGGFKTGFSANTITTAYVSGTAAKENYPAGSKADFFPAGWEIGVMSPSIWNDRYYVSNNSSGGEYFNAGSSWMSGNRGGGFYFGSGQLVAPIAYLDQNTKCWIDEAGKIYNSAGEGRTEMIIGDSNNDGTVNNNDRLFLRLDSNVLVRYTAEYSGTISIDIAQLKFGYLGNAKFCILHNGLPIGQFNTADFNYATGAGWYEHSETGKNLSSEITDIANLSVKAGDKIDFVFRGAETDGRTLSSFDYNGAKRLCDDWKFLIEYSNFQTVTGATVETGFSLFENFLYSSWYSENKDNLSSLDFNHEAHKGDTFDYSNSAWKLGSILASYEESKVSQSAAISDYLTFNTATFYPYDRVSTASSSSQFFIVGDNNGMNGAGNSKSGSVYIQEDGNAASGARKHRLMIAPGAVYNSYNSNGGNMVTVDGVTYYDRKVTSFPSTASVRYVAPYTGDVTVSISGLFDSGRVAPYAYVYVLRNGENIATIEGKDGTTVNATVTTSLVEGDTLDFVAFVDPRFSALAMDKTNEAFYNEETAKAWGSSNSLNAARRLFEIKDIRISYTDAMSSESSTWLNGATLNLPSDVTSLGDRVKSNVYRFFEWYNAGGTALSNGSTLTSDCYATLNPAMKEWAGITDDMTLKAAFAAYMAAYKADSYLEYADDAWEMVAIRSDGTSAVIKYPAYYHNIPFALVEQSGAKVRGNLEGQFYVTEKALDLLMNNIWSKTLTAASLSDTATVGETKMYYSSALNSTFKNNVYNDDVTTASDVYCIRPTNRGSTNSCGAYRYTIESNGIVSLRLDNISYSNAGSFTWNIRHNGEYLFDSYQTADISTAAGVQALKEVIASKAFVASIGDVVEFCFARNEAGNATIINPTLSVVVSDDSVFKSSVNLAIADAYAINLSVTPEAADSKVEVLVDGKVVATMNAKSGYKYTLKDGINVFELTATKSDSAAWDNLNIDGVSVSYQLREEVNGHVAVSKVYETNTDKLLAAYESGAYGQNAAKLARDVRHMAIAANAALFRPNGSGDLATSEKHYLRGRPDGSAGSVVGTTDAALAELKANNAGYTFTGTKGVYGFAAVNVNLDDNMSVVLLMKANEGGSLEELRNGGYYVKATNGSVEKIGDDIKTVLVGKTEYMGVIVRVPVSMWNQDFAYTIMDKDGNAVSNTLNYSLQDWCASNYQDNSWASFASYVCRAVYNLGVSAATYKANPNV